MVDEWFLKREYWPHLLLCVRLGLKSKCSVSGDFLSVCPNARCYLGPAHHLKWIRTVQLPFSEIGWGYFFHSRHFMADIVEICFMKVFYQILIWRPCRLSCFCQKVNFLTIHVAGASDVALIDILNHACHTIRIGWKDQKEWVLFLVFLYLIFEAIFTAVRRC